MDEDEHEVYGGEIPVEGDMDADNADVEMARSEDDAAKLQELDEMKKRLKEMEDEAAALREMQAKVEKEMGAVQDPAGAAATQASREEADSRSVFVGNVDYSCTPEEVQQHFQACGTVNRVTILTDKFGQPKGFAYVEFLEVEAVQEALLLNESELHGRQLKVSAKRTNVPGMKQFRGRRFNPYMGFRSRRPYVPPYFYSPYGYGSTYFSTYLAIYLGTEPSWNPLSLFQFYALEPESLESPQVQKANAVQTLHLKCGWQRKTFTSGGISRDNSANLRLPEWLGVPSLTGCLLNSNPAKKFH
ncbi:RNA recognition motif domain [Macleaya cordata]|uniref:RNA recognition motif domain n=1 Tax=Macleaya cordata TaxID=56857 RepID=A0A200PN26_MACCD|nr:RNA recognition motif domain [Macleaya cordata]